MCVLGVCVYYHSELLSVLLWGSESERSNFKPDWAKQGHKSGWKNRFWLCVYMYTHVCIHMEVCEYTHMCECMWVCARTCGYLCVCVHVYTCQRVSVPHVWRRHQLEASWCEWEEQM